MSKFKTLFFILFLITLFTKIICDLEPSIISIDYSEEIKLSKDSLFNVYYALQYTEEDLSNKNYLVIKAESTSFQNPAFIYTSFTEKNPSADIRTFYSQTLGKNEIILNISKLKGFNKLYINIHSLKECQLKFEVSTKNEISLSLDNKKTKFKLSDTNKIVFTFPQEISKKKIMIYSIGESANYFSMNVEFSYNNIKKEFNGYQKFENGYGTLINLSEIENSYLGTFIINILPNKSFPGIFSDEKVVEVGIDLTEEGTATFLEPNILEHIYGYISTNENCYKIKNLDDTKNITILLNTYTQSLSFALYDNESNTKKYSLDIFNNYYIKLPGDYFYNNYFCFKKFTPKEKEIEELGEISYDFQIYYDDELSEIQTYLSPLINGRIYTHSLKAGEIMIYRHSSFTRFNFLYSASMNVLRGKPILYGYSCKTFPECNLDNEKLDNLKNTDDIDIINPINQYFINKKYYALGDQDKYGEKMSEARGQYLSVVRCESTEDLPNYGECQYTIEIDSYLDEIQLIPELVFTNSLQFYKNYYRIKVADYKNIEYLKIYFTILTGNANINLYSDIEHKNLITKYKYRHVHRKEVIEITEDFLENYYILINSNDSAFVEIKYETDFYYRGYMRMNPNEVNIEFVNKENDFVPYEINNPDYFYPTDNPKNSDFYFTIKTLDCSMIYKYNFIDFVNITSIHHEVKTNDINFGTSYAFMLKVENYFHTTKDNKEDCAMIIYTGEESKNTPLLIFEDIPNPSNFTDTYYIYPFSISSAFDGIIVEIKLDNEYLTQMKNAAPLIYVTFKINNQKDNFESYYIKRDYTFYITKKTISKYCPTNYYQCSLIIEINKIFGEEEIKYPYVITTNVHSSMSSVEYIYKNKVYNHNLNPKSSKYFYTQIDKDEEGEINFMFNEGNGRLYAKLVEKNIVEEKYNWNKRVKLPDIYSNDLLYYDPLNNVVKYSTKNNNNCINGCELYIHIESEENTKKDSSLTEVSFNVVDKKKDMEIKENSVVEMDMNKYVKGIIEKNDYKFYTFTVPEDYYKISVNLYSQYGKAYIKIGKGHSCKEDEYYWELIPINNFGRIIIHNTDVKIDHTSLKRVSFSIGITSNKNIPENIEDNSLFYYLEVQGLYNNDKEYYHLTSERSIICNTENENYCHILLNINHYYNINYRLIYASSLKENSENINIYSKFYIESDFEQKTYKDSIQSLFPNDTDCSQNSNGKNYLLLNSEKMNEKIDNYILLTIDCGKKNSLIKLILSGNDVSKTLTPYKTEKLIWLYRDINFYLPYDYNNDEEKYNYLVNIRSLKGTAELAIRDGESFTDISGNYYLEAKSFNSIKSFEINYIEETALIITYEKLKKDKIFMIEKNVKNEVSFYFSEDNAFPQYVYTKLNSALKVEILFHDISYNEFLNEDIFCIKAYIINENTLNNRIINPETVIKGDIIEGYYLKYEKTGIIKIESNKIKTDDEYYLYIIIDKDVNNKNIYKSIKTQYSVNEIESGIEIYPNKYYFSGLDKIDSYDYYLIKKKSEEDKYLVIDIAESLPVKNNFNYSVNYANRNIHLKENEIQEINYNGRKRIICNLGLNNGIELKINKNSNGDENCKNYSINYYSLNNINSFENYSNFNDSLVVTKNNENNKKSNLIFNNMWRFKRFFTVQNIIYYIDIFEKNNNIKDYNSIYTTYMGNDDEKLVKKMIVNDIFLFNQEISVEMDYSKDNLKDKYFVRVLADIYNNDGTRDKFLYNSTLIDNDKKKKVDINENLILYVILYMVIVCIVIMLIVFIFLKIHRKKNQPAEPDLNTSNMPLNDKSRSSDV